ncbi:hypothetical protein ACFYUH_37220 [Streptomyces fimicarius]|uniref:hypothetical protein n=1 Tax=Streptomyces griseus TaxID=1911 RepID=UPI0036AB0E20
MDSRRVRESPSLRWFSRVGLGLFVLSAALTALIAPYARNYASSFVFLTLCLPWVWVSLRAAFSQGPDEWTRYGRDGMARIGSLRVTDTDEGGTSYYTTTGALRLNGERLSLVRFSEREECEEVLDALGVVPVRYLPETKRAQFRDDLVRMVLDCEDPLAPSPERATL